MATNNNNDKHGAICPVPYNDVVGSAAQETETPVAGLSGNDDPNKQGTWIKATFAAGIVAVQQSFRPRDGDVFIASVPKCGTTWLKALAFATMARGVYPPDDAAHPLLRLNPHGCVPHMEWLFGTGQESAIEALPSPRLFATHMQHSILPSSITSNPACKIVFICREPKDMVVSLWHFCRKSVEPDVSFSDVFEAVCQGTYETGPFWDHVLGYWNASKASAETVLFLRYEDMLRDPAGNVRKLARFVGQPFSTAEEDAGVVAQIVSLCSLNKLKNLEVNKPASSTSSRQPIANDWFFRKGEAGDWVNHMTPDMARRLDAIVEEKLSGSGLSFA